jgi:membrane associated rhomboid family serine protease
MQSGLGMLILLNLGITFLVPNISIGGHLGGLIGGAIAALLMDHVARNRVGAGVAVCVAVGAVAAAGAIAVA